MISVCADSILSKDKITVSILLTLEFFIVPLTREHLCVCARACAFCVHADVWVFMFVDVHTHGVEA